MNIFFVSASLVTRGYFRYKIIKEIKMKMKCLSGLVLVLTGSVAHAECSSAMDAEKMVECIMVEGSGANYQDWKKEFDKLAEDSSNSAPDQSMISMTVPGADITKVKPAAGKKIE